MSENWPEITNSRIDQLQAEMVKAVEGAETAARTAQTALTALNAAGQAVDDLRKYLEIEREREA